MDESVLERAEEILGHRFQDRSVLELALTHASVSESRLSSNERLEFLGDAILGQVVCEMIFHRFPRMLEGEMTKIKSSVVSRRTCARLARRLGLDKLLDMGKGMQMHPELPPSLAAAVFEAVIAALHIDGGPHASRRFIESIIEPVIEQAAQSGHQQNFKSVLQQHAQQVLGVTPSYRVLDEKGPDHAKAFKVAVELDGLLFPSAWGQSKKQAEQEAALNALTELGVIQPNDDGEYMVVRKESDS
ncbi:MAG: ribonuclease III [Planctomycetota bacterium]|nr:MAG: ribonuclease III [Planctomycetota bacterium]